jgi:RNA-binding protein
MTPLTGSQRKYLRGLAHSRKPIVLIGQHGLTVTVLRFINDALDRHELIKIKFNEHKEKDQKQAICARIAEGTAGEMVGMVGHTAIFFRCQPDPEKRVIQLPG